jgi:hypothetical protein
MPVRSRPGVGKREIRLVTAFFEIGTQQKAPKQALQQRRMLPRSVAPSNGYTTSSLLPAHCLM